MKSITQLITVIAAAASAAALAADNSSLCRYVDPMIGSGGHGHVFVGANVPRGFAQPGPSQLIHGWDWCSGYHYSDSIILGFSQMHLSGTGIGDLGDILLMPANRPGVTSSRFSHSRETAGPGYYRVTLDDAGTDVELTATCHVAAHRYTFAPCDSAYVSINTLYGIGWDSPTDVSIMKVDDRTVCGYRFSHGWAADQRVFFYAEFSRPMIRCELTDTLTTCVFTPSVSPLEVKVGLSPNSIGAACANLHAEAADAGFDSIRDHAVDRWDSELGRIRISTGDRRAKRIFYTAMYHAMTAPVTFSDVGAPTRYSVLSLWDTYRAAHPLYTLVLPEIQQDLADTFLDIYRQDGKLPVWYLHGNETNCMVGNPGIIVMGDLILKGLVNNPDEAYEAMCASAMLDERGLGAYKRYGYIPYDHGDGMESVARGLEYAIADDAVARAGRRLGDTRAGYFGKRGKAYRHYFDPATGFMRGRDSAGNLREGVFDPFSTSHRSDDYCEGNAWQYLWLVPHDPHGLFSLLGSPAACEAKLDSLFLAEGDLGADASPDISGLIGQYAHGNEPSHHTIYLYNYMGRPSKASPLLRHVMTKLYDDSPGGLCGNEDVGQMSAWYILSSLGLYQVEPAGGKFVIGSPLFDSATLDVGGGRTFTIEASGNSPENIFVRSAELNGQKYTRGYIMYDDINRGGHLKLTMSPVPSDFGTSESDRP